MEFQPTQPVQQGNKNTVLIVVGVIAAVLCACLLIASALGLVVYQVVSKNIQTAIPNFPTFEPPSPTPPVVVTRPPAESISTATLEALKAAVVPEDDPYALACRLQGICGVPHTLPAAEKPYQIGDKQKFWISNSNTDENFQIEATLLYITPHTYFWAERPEDVNKADLKALMDTFENKIYPTDREFFGSEWNPGVDDDPHIYVVYAGNIGSSVAGYYSSYDEYNPAVRQYSNSHELYVLGTVNNLGDEYTYSTLAHEFVHMIQFASDRNDASWLDEGFAELGAFLNGYGEGGADWEYAQNPDLQLTDWADPNSPEFGAHYGSSFLYLAYFLDRFGEKATKALTANPDNDISSVDSTLAELNITDPVIGKPVTADDVFMDWAATLFVHDDSVGDGRYIYHNYADAPQTGATETVYDCPSGKMNRNVHQYGIDYITINCPSYQKGDTHTNDPHTNDSNERNPRLVLAGIASIVLLLLIAVIGIVLIGVILKKKWGFYLGGAALLLILLVGVIMLNTSKTTTIGTATPATPAYYTLHFEGSTAASLLPVDAHSGKFAFWSNKGNNSDMTLTREFDFTNATGPVSLAYSTWYDIEENWDYLNLEVSTDGQHWEIIKTPSGTDSNPQGNAYGWGYTGTSNGWIEESVDLSAYAGKKVQVRFEYITDPNVNGEGFLLDDVRVDAINYSEDFESGGGGWVGEGFVRVENVLPQIFRLALIVDHNGTITVQNVEVSADQVADIPLSLENGDTATLIVTGVTRFTRSLANYSIEIR